MIRLVTLGEIMKKLDVAKLMTFSDAIGLTEGAYLASGDKGKLGPDLVAHAKRTFRGIEEHCLEFGLVASLASCRRLFQLLQSESGVGYPEFASTVIELRSRVQDETEATHCLSLDIQETSWYTQPLERWEPVVRRFREATTDIEEAMRCLALERYAAAVFHSCQTVEIGLIELGTFLMVSDPKSGFTAVSKALRRVIEKPYNTLTPFERDHFAFIEQVQALVESLKNAWRNKISHAQGKLYLLSSDWKRDTTEEIIFATRAFMRRLAENLPDRVDAAE